MIRTALIALFLTASLNTQAAGYIRAEVQQVTIGAQDWDGRPTLCVVVVKNAETEEMLGLVEDIYDCYWTRLARQQKVLRVPVDAFAPMNNAAMLQHLQGLDSQLEFFWSTAD